MKNVISNEKIPIKMWLTEIEDGAFAQAINLANLPFAFHHIALMPDAHLGYGMPIGGVLATKGVVIPNAVGVDIGCGMCAVKTSLTVINTKDLNKIVEAIRKVIPVGFEHQKEAQDRNLMPITTNDFYDYAVLSNEYMSALKQLGTLGGGNHFIEIQKGLDGFIWIMIHSGSRNLGKKVADHYNKLAVKLNERWCSSVPKAQELAFLPIETEEAKNYIKEMNYCVDFAFANRRLMIDRVLLSIMFVLGKEFDFDPIINIAHNYARWEHHFKEDVLVHRKGATSAKLGEIGIIPGSQGTSSYIVQGLGNAGSFQSCSHGAGRKMGRGAATRNLDLKLEMENMDKQGIIHSIRTTADLDEAPGAYKDIKTVMENQDDLVRILVELKPLAVIKG